METDPLITSSMKKIDNMKVLLGGTTNTQVTTMGTPTRKKMMTDITAPAGIRTIILTITIDPSSIIYRNIRNKSFHLFKKI